MFRLCCCNNKNVFWVTSSYYNGSGMLFIIHNHDIAGVFDCLHTYGIIMNSKRCSPLSAGLVRVKTETGKPWRVKTSAFRDRFTRTIWFLWNVLTGRRKNPQVEGWKIIEVRITGHSFWVECDSVYVAIKQTASRWCLWLGLSLLFFLGTYSTSCHSKCLTYAICWTTILFREK